MSFLAMIFGLGALAVAFPFLFHLIRRTPRGQQPFGSLMFLKPSPPRITRRSRLENLLLLVLRMAAISLIALAFMRPYILSSAMQMTGERPGRRVAVLVDASASMRRGDLWQQAVDRAQQIAAELEPEDEIGLFVFEDRIDTALDFESVRGRSGQLPSLVPQLLNERGPRWGATQLAQAMMTVADQMVADNEAVASNAKMQMIVISDMQNGAFVNPLASYQWPEGIRVQFDRVNSATANASIRVVPSAGEDEQDEQEGLRVQVANSGESTVEQFSIAPDGGSPAAGPDSEPVYPIYVPAGSSRVVKVPLNQQVGSSGNWTLSGDGVDFDNTFYVAPVVQQTVRVRYFGRDDVQDPTQMQYFFQKSLFQTPTRKIELFNDQSDPIPDAFNLMVVTCQLDDPATRQVTRHLENGGWLLIVLQDDEMVASMTDWLGVKATDPEPVETPSERYKMLVDIDFQHPLFVDFSKPRFNDFTKVKFWKRWKVELADSPRRLASFDDNSPAIWQHRVGPGTVIGMSGGWQPTHSQLALSSKFVPLVASIIDLSAGGIAVPDSCLVNQPVALPAGDEIGEMKVIRPDASTVDIEDRAAAFSETDLPGIYRIVNVKDEKRTEQSFAVNLDPRESDTAAMEIGRIEAFGVKVGIHPTAREQAEQMQTLQRLELENRQKLWKWLLVAALVLLVGETWLAGRTARQNQPSDGSSLSPAS